MKAFRTTRRLGHDRALNALKLAILEGATYDYERLIDQAVYAGATDAELDVMIHEALETLFRGAEQPVTERALAHFCPVEPLHEVLV